jgi:hypothetical protein
MLEEDDFKRLGARQRFGLAFLAWVDFVGDQFARFVAPFADYAPVARQDRCRAKEC